MASFNSLPPELVQLIVDFVQPGDILAVSMINRIFRTVSKEHVDEYHDYRKKYGVFYFRIDDDSNDPEHSMLDVLCQVLEHPRLAAYCHTLIVENVYLDGEREELSVHHSNLIRKALQSSPFILEAEVEPWLEKISLGNGDSIMAILFPLLRNLRTFGYRIYREDDDPSACPLSSLMDLTSVLHRMVKAEASLSINTPLQALESVILEGPTDDDRHLIHPLVAFPAVQSLRLQYSKLSDEFSWDDDLPRSKLRVLDIQRSSTSSAFLSDFLRPMTELEMFSYSDNWALVGLQLEYTLLKAARTSLRSLDLRNSQDWSNLFPFERLNEFEILESLSIGTWCLLGFHSEIPRRMCALSERLPCSLKHLRVQFNQEFLHPTARAKPQRLGLASLELDAKVEDEIKKLLEFTNDYKPPLKFAKLKKLTIEGAGLERDLRLAAACKRTGVSFEANPEVEDSWPPTYYGLASDRHREVKENYDKAKQKAQSSESTIDDLTKRHYYIPGGLHGSGRYVFATEAFVLGIDHAVHQDQIGMANEFSGNSRYFERWWDPDIVEKFNVRSSSPPSTDPAADYYSGLSWRFIPEGPNRNRGRCVWADANGTEVRRREWKCGT